MLLGKLELFLIGGSTLIFSLLMNTVFLWTVSSQAKVHLYTYYVGSLLALLIYQPHFIATYQMNYSRGWDYIRKNYFILLVQPLIFLLFILFVFLNEFIFFNQSVNVIYKPLLIFTILAGLWHFSAQSFGVTLKYAQPVIENNKQRIIIVGKLIFFITALYGLISYMNFNSGRYKLFNLSFDIPYVSNSFMSIFLYSLIVVHIALWLHLRKLKFKWQGMLPWLALIAWYMTDLFTTRYFYLIPVAHAMQFIPLYYKSIDKKNGLLLTFLILLFSVFIIFALPNYIEETVLAQTQLEKSFIFVVLLLCINLHHFSMERISWKYDQRPPA